MVVIIFSGLFLATSLMQDFPNQDIPDISDIQTDGSDRRWLDLSTINTSVSNDYRATGVLVSVNDEGFVAAKLWSRD